MLTHTSINYYHKYISTTQYVYIYIYISSAEYRVLYRALLQKKPIFFRSLLMVPNTKNTLLPPNMCIHIFLNRCKNSCNYLHLCATKRGANH